MGRVYWENQAKIRRLSTDETVETVAEPGLFFALSVQTESTVYAIRGEHLWHVSDGQLASVAGVGRGKGRGDGGPAIEARFASVQMAVPGRSGELYVYDAFLNRIRVIDTDGVIHNFAGNGESLPTRLTGSALEAQFQFVSDIAVDSTNRLLIADSQGWLGRVENDGALSTLVPRHGSCSLTCGDGGPSTESRVPELQDIAADGLGNIYAVNRRRDFRPEIWLRRIRPDGVIETPSPILPDGSRAEQVLAIAVDSQDNLVVAMRSGSSAATYWRYHPDTGWEPRLELASRLLSQPAHCGLDTSGNIFVSERFLGPRFRVMTPEGNVATVAGGQMLGDAGDGGPAGAALISRVRDLDVDQFDNVIFVDGDNRRVRAVRDASSCPIPPRPVLAGGSTGLVNGAAFTRDLAPGTIFSAFGHHLGPDDLVVAEMSGGKFPTELGGTRVKIDGIPVPLIFVSKSQLNGIVPAGATISLRLAPGGGFDQIESPPLSLEFGGFTNEPTRVRILDAAPGLFSLDSPGSGQGAILNQDGTINGVLNPAAPGSVVVMFGTGAGVMDPPSVDGELASPPLSRPILSVEVEFDGQLADVLYAGDAPGLVRGVLQVNARIPADPFRRGAVPILLRVGRHERSNVFVILGE